MLLQPAQVQFHLPLVGNLERTDFEVDSYESMQPAVIGCIFFC
jgi:hypothetical protein